ncbi:MAG: PSD1 and planctomycete cytochrome C domain-containing protein [Planctomycetes bacterium]|nr:PSD1 and planctomycete cytochrome C domain-containing protein [Planctomycetota bacterium]
MRLSPFLATLSTAAALSFTAGSTAGLVNVQEPQREVSFGRDIRPILSDRCFQCHGPDSETRAENLRLDIPENALAPREGYSILAPGKPNNSELWLRISTEHDDDLMPPLDSKKKALSEEEKELIRLWIEQGAVFEDHWAFSPPTVQEIPGVADSTWPINQVDHFILHEMETVGLSPNQAASPDALARRVFLDLTGLPPTPEEMEAFLKDKREDAYEHLVDRLLTEEPYVTRYAERMAVPWLDAARYADTNGIHMDAGRQIWPWRDWVLTAFRENMPFNQFIEEQIAGDLLPDATVEQKIASGFHRNHVLTDEGGAIDAEYLVEYAADRVQTTGEVFLGLTVGCARCHDHKFDPVSQEDYFSLFAYFNSIDEVGLYSQNQDTNRAFVPMIEAPSPMQLSRMDAFRSELEGIQATISESSPEDVRAYEEFTHSIADQLGVSWAPTFLLSASATAGSQLEVQPDGSALAIGSSPSTPEDYVLTLRTNETNLRTLLLEALQDPSLPHGRIGRASNGNAVLSGLNVKATSVEDSTQSKQLDFIWAWADHEQQNSGYDYEVVNSILPPRDAVTGWAVDGHRLGGGRMGMFVTDQPFGYTGGTILEATLSFDSTYAQHQLGRTKLTVGTISDKGLAALPVADSQWYGTWPYSRTEELSGYDQEFGPELDATIDFKKKYGPNQYSWVTIKDFKDGAVNNSLPAGDVVSFLGKRLFVPSARPLEISLGSDDGIQVFLDGTMVFENRINRGAAPNQDKVILDLTPGIHTVVLKIVNTGGPGGYYWKQLEHEDVLGGSVVWSLVPKQSREIGVEGLASQLITDWRAQHSPVFKKQTERAGELEVEMQTLQTQIPRTMVMRERAERRQTYVLTRGEYDHPDLERPVERNIPRSLGSLPEGAPDDRRGLATWMTSAENPLVSRVFANRFWEWMFGTGIVTTSQDFGYQGEWPSHPELLDWLALHLQNSGWDTQAFIKLLVTSNTYRQSSHIRPEAKLKDPNNRLVSSYPRRRLGAEEIRDQALYISGLLIEQLGGPSVKPYQPSGLWKEVAMPQSNTSNFVRGNGDDLWRRSLYTYWKRASPPRLCSRSTHQRGSFAQFNAGQPTPRFKPWSFGTMNNS